MQINTENEKPIFMQIAEQLEDSIFIGAFLEEEKIPSTNEIAMLFNINPHTVLKGMNLLVAENMLYKKRGLGMYVREGAVEQIKRKRQNQFYSQYVETLLQEAKKLEMSKEQLIKMIEGGFSHD